jgi:predicted ATP-binding protein involved in virulence
MIIAFKRGTRYYNLYDNKDHNNQNIFTVIVGKNGTGKSRLLNDIISNFIPTKQMNSIDVLLARDLPIIPKIDLQISNIPDKVIAVSTSPYDKFPLSMIFSRSKQIENYCYLGIRDLRTTNFSLGFISKIIGQLLHIRNNDKARFSKIVEVLNYLGYTDEFHITFELRILNDQINVVLNYENPEENFIEFFSNLNLRYHLQFFKREDETLNTEKFKRFIDLLQKIKDRKKRIYHIVVDAQNINSEIEIDDISFLIEIGLIKLRNVSLTKLNSDKIYKISEASSGEQCIFTTLVGISCNISDNSLILIDEPEISLHPEWQEKYITLLMETFRSFKNCHFIIATHSPQLISKLATENCYILQMDTKELKNAKYFANNSIDFQLANIFNSPGFKNEYLSRIAFSIISKVAKNKEFDEDDLKNYQLIKSQINFLQENDPILNLYNLINDLKK